MTSDSNNTDSVRTKRMGHTQVAADNTNSSPVCGRNEVQVPTSATFRLRSRAGSVISTVKGTLNQLKQSVKKRSASVSPSQTPPSSPNSHRWPGRKIHPITEINYPHLKVPTPCTSTPTPPSTPTNVRASTPTQSTPTNVRASENPDCLLTTRSPLAALNTKTDDLESMFSKRCFFKKIDSLKTEREKILEPLVEIEQETDTSSAEPLSSLREPMPVKRKVLGCHDDGRPTNAQSPPPAC